MSTKNFITPEGKKLVTVIHGDGVGAEVVKSTQRIIEATGAPIAWEERLAGEEVFKMGYPSGVLPETIESIKKTRVVLKGPLGTPIGYGEKSANVTLRKLFETYGNIRPVREMPGVKTPFSGRGVDLVVVRENVEDLYAGIEYMQTPGVALAYKLISRKGSEKIVRLAFELARAEGRKKIHCATKSNILKFSEGMLKHTFEEIAKEYPDIEANHIIVDNACHQLVRRPEQFDVIVTSNMNGDIMSDLTSGLIGGLGFAPSANLGSEVAIFEAVHGSAPKYKDKDVINPTAMIMSAIMMLRHLGEFKASADIEHAIFVTLEQGILTRDVLGDVGAVSTTAYTNAIISNLGKRSENWQVREYAPIKIHQFSPALDFVHATTRKVVGVDIYLESAEIPQVVGETLTTVSEDLPVYLKMISNRGTKVYPPTEAITDCVDQHCCRFMVRNHDVELDDATIQNLLNRVSQKFRYVQIEKLQEFDGEQTFTKAQGED